MSSEIVEFAPAKINLTLNILGRRADGYHELESLVAFARNVGDTVGLTVNTPPALSVVGPTGGAIGIENLAERAMRLVSEAHPEFAFGALRLDKQLPVAGGVGGGSADAAAVLRLLRRANANRASAVDWLAIARRLGADVPVCFAGKAALMTGAGESLWPVRLPNGLAAVLVNSNAAMPRDKTARVFEQLRAPDLRDAPYKPDVPTFADSAGVIAYVAERENALQAPAMVVMPNITMVLKAIEATDERRVARMSGAGPTCFGLYATPDAASTAARKLEARFPDWWIRSAELS